MSPAVIVERLREAIHLTLAQEDVDCFAALAMTGESSSLSLLRVKQRHRRIHDHLDQAGAVMREAALQRIREFG